MNSCKDLEVKGKRVFLRVDFNVPLDDTGHIRDDTRIRAALPTIKHLLDHRAKVITASHLGRPKGTFKPKLSLSPVAEKLSRLIGKKVLFAPDVIGEKVDQLKKNLKEGEILLLENLRFHDGEESNDAEFAKKMADSIDYYVNDAFGASHRAHASIVGIPEYVEKTAAGFLLTKEIEYLNKAIHSPEKPYVAILGGAKVSDKIPVIQNLLNKADSILIGGAMAYTFFASEGLGVGRSLVEEEKKNLAIELMFKAKERNVEFRLPLDHIIAAEIASGIETKTVDSFPIPSDMMALDIGPVTIHHYSRIIAGSKTILWNGPMGVFEIDDFATGTTKIAEAVAGSGALSIVGGGDSVAAVDKAGVSNKISHISTGGGASLEYIANEALPGLDAIKEK